MMKEYIEREAALACVCEDCSGQNGCNVPCVDYVRIKSLPAADVVEVRHGRWMKCHDVICYWLACSVCGEEIPKRFGTDYYTNYCPNCGAKMDGGAGNG